MFIIMRGGTFPYPVGVAIDEAVAVVRSALIPGEAFYIEVPEFTELLPPPEGEALYGDGVASPRGESHRTAVTS